MRFLLIFIMLATLGCAGTSQFAEDGEAKGESLSSVELQEHEFIGPFWQVELKRESHSKLVKIGVILHEDDLYQSRAFMQGPAFDHSEPQEIYLLSPEGRLTIENHILNLYEFESDSQHDAQWIEFAWDPYTDDSKGLPSVAWIRIGEADAATYEIELGEEEFLYPEDR